MNNNHSNLSGLSDNFSCNNGSKTVSNPATTTIGALIMSLAFLIGVPGNLFIIWSIMVLCPRGPATTLLILNLACADGFLMCISLFFIIYLARDRNWDFGEVMCKILFYLCNINMYASIFLIMLMSLNRLVAVVWPKRMAALASKRNAVWAIAVVWILVFFISIPNLVFRKERHSDQNDPNNKHLECVAEHPTSQLVVFQYTFETVVGFLVPYSIIVTSYFCILMRLRQTKFRRNVRSEKLILAIVLTFGVLWLPYHLMNIIQVVAALADLPIKCKLNEIWKPSQAVTSAFAFISSCANPVLYTFAGKSYIKEGGMAFMARWNESYKKDLFSSRINKTTTLAKAIAASPSPPHSWVLVTGVACYKSILTARYTEDRVVLGRGGGAMGQMMTPFWLGLGGTLGSGRQPFPWIHVSDLARIITHTIETPHKTLSSADGRTQEDSGIRLSVQVPRPEICPEGDCCELTTDANRETW
ncbi:hypothetical protein UPYG_G00293640 [Umbra pygmaea]|uniref:G-protein coupled receptors family 1 profile domain-containing protein n=1 Tax=Umbra pygmaea TaxID=75934 RepID=A0ABD0W9S7_UMBPY